MALEYCREVVEAQSARSILIGNSDMHLKNFSMLREHNGDWRLAAGYDLLPVKMLMPQDLDELALNLNGKKRHLARKDFVAKLVVGRKVKDVIASLKGIRYRREIKTIKDNE